MRSIGVYCWASNEQNDSESINEGVGAKGLQRARQKYGAYRFALVLRTPL